MSDVTQVLQAIEQGRDGAANELLPLVYDELRKLASSRLASEPPGQTLQATALVHDAFLRLVDVEQQQHWNSRGHFFGAAAEAMRRILVENARRKSGLKRGGDLTRCELPDVAMSAADLKHDLLALNAALEALESTDTQAATLVKLRYFAGLTVAETAESLGISLRSAERLWTWARAWLFRELDGGEQASEPRQ